MTPAPKICGCGARISQKNTSGRCVGCAAKHRRRVALTPEQRAARAAQMRALSADPAIVAKRGAAIKATMADPERRENHREACRLGVMRKLDEDPTYRAQLVEIGHRVGKVNLAKAREGDVRARAGRSIRSRHLDWCPPEFWDLNRSLKRKGFVLAERKAIIFAEVPGTAEHARRAVHNADLAGKLKHAREVAQRY